MDALSHDERVAWLRRELARPGFAREVFRGQPTLTNSMLRTGVKVFREMRARGLWALEGRALVGVDEPGL